MKTWDIYVKRYVALTFRINVPYRLKILVSLIDIDVTTSLNTFTSIGNFNSTMLSKVFENWPVKPWE